MPKTKFTTVAVGRWTFESFLHFFDIYVREEGIVGLYQWQQTDFRFPVLSMLVHDIPKRLRARGKTPEQIAEMDEESFFVPWEKIEGIVTHDLHKEVKIRTPEEIITLLFNQKHEYDQFIPHLQEKIPKKVFSRDAKKIPQSIYEGMPVPEEKVVLR